ncbi:alpha/beta hydrolase [Sandarakinorhabdus sp.]|uniref:alpha/beta hydrolase n=1 Tax=Sandarakinorhabdus sp. TaxID=1916663 RepID=UPI00286E7C6B|nr:alpha/beta hydrolase [Sandarakinorhabdus sp.]
MPYVRPDVQNLLNILAAQPGPILSEMPPEGGRQMMLAMGPMLETPRGELAEVKELSIPAPHGSIPARLYRAALSDAPAPVIIYLHGGGWVIGDLETHDSLCAEIARLSGITVVSVDYRLAPEHVFPAAADDAITAADWVAASPAEIGHPVSGIIPAGDSAGGNLAAVICQARADTLHIPAQWLIYPGVDMTAAEGSMVEFADGYLLTAASMRWFMDHYLPAGVNRLDPRASPLHAETRAGQPPALVFTCSLDPLRDQGRAYAGRLIEHGVRAIFREAEGQIHGSATLRMGLPSAQADLVACIADLKQLLTVA